MIKSPFARQRILTLLLASSFFIFSPKLYALSINIQSGKEQGQTYATLHIQETTPFICQEDKNDFFEVTQIECFFTKAPHTSFNPLKNAFFSVASYETPTLYVIRIKPIEKIKLYDMIDSIAQKHRIDHEPKRQAKHWMVVGFKEHLPLIQEHHVPSNGLNFPIDFFKSDLPIVGALGLNGKPIELDQVEDVSDYLDIRKLFKRGLYDQAMSLIDKVLQNDPNSIFKSEFMLYKIRILMLNEAYDDVIEHSKAFLRNFSADEAIPEVLLMIADASSKMGMVIDAEYFYDRLLTEHYESKEATKGLIHLGAHALANGDGAKALKYFKEALKKAETKEVASEAASKLANYYLAKGRSKDAAFYMEKIAKANIAYLLEDYDRTFEIAKEFSDHEAYKEAANFMMYILNSMEQSDRNYEPLLYQIAVWYDQANENAKAYQLYKRYSDQFEFGDYKNDVEVRMDKVLFKMGEANKTKELALYNTIEEKYAQEEIAKKALYKKAELLYQMQSYQKVLDLQPRLNRLDLKRYPKSKELVLESAKALAKKSLDAKDCQRTILLLRNYGFTMSNENAQALYSCSMQESDYRHAVEIASEHIKDKALDKRIVWLYDYVIASSKAGDQKSVYVAGQDLLTLIDMDKKSQQAYQAKRAKIYKAIFHAALALGYEEKAIAMATELEKLHGLRFEDIEIYVNVVHIAKARKDFTMLETYAYKVINLQKKAHSYSQSPAIEFLALSALKKLQKNQAAHELLKDLSLRIKTAAQGARIFYELGNIALQLGKKKEAKAAFIKSSNADKNSPWSKLSRDALKML